MYKLYFELTKFDSDGSLINSDSYLINLSDHGVFYRLVILPIIKLFKKWSLFE